MIATLVAGGVRVRCINMMGISGVGELALRSCAAGRNSYLLVRLKYTSHDRCRQNLTVEFGAHVIS
ncbi:hypothetical protein TOPH_04783 [Tolypocladium ophioglossoides CBS 100239]|uniref:Uncharacterized protein n=1 Tax=Tolypocladium ophioglossoides (strain CBS 100239) TaxID=1163406 RepID=A0A0L0N8X7_TOLOC|nr:hypothetical protein TOPH_04783 [Tolypocladium ophioglossoides CBS 100239]